ncbi:hypothetical protein [Chamaesiphon sp. VAR_48_metabat_135_sub]|uniref:hypothetical protein n=1 Tax=Chamaesiphon sp. VAR_48_metabat_135_sub TaxID=2964699 RepID=UPI00286B4AD5|nr:hypothetical protein [Chamaesiphon sp. VAR_48_metabat_135_sub]
MHHHSITLLLSGAIGILLSGCHTIGELVKSQPAQTATGISIPRPEYLQPVADPIFGTTVTRVSDRARFGSELPELRHLYSKNQPWNADESYLLLNYKYPAALLDGRTYKFIRWVRQPSEGVWSNLNPALMYGTIAKTNQFVKLNVTKGNDYTVLHKFREYDLIHFGEWEGNLSNNDRYAALVGVKAGKLDFLVYDLFKNRVTSRKTQPNGTTISNGNESTVNNLTMSQSGKYLVVQYNQEGQGVQRGIHLLDRSSLKSVRQLSKRGGSHFDTCINARGAEAIVVTDDTSPALVSVQYSTGKKTTLLPASKSNYNIHVSCRNLKRPGWVYVSEFAGDIDPEQPDLVKTTPDRTFALKLDGSGTIEQFAQPNHSPSKAYERQPHSVPNRDGKKVLFASDWGDPADPVYAYITRKKR